MGRRHYQRIQREVSVTVSGLDSSGNSFTQTATTVEISARGLRLRGISCLRGQRGEPLLVKYKNKRCRYRIAWAGEPGTEWQDIIGLEAIDDASLMFGDHLPDTAAHVFDSRMDAYVVPPEIVPTAPMPVAEHPKSDPSHDERRSHPRYACSASASICEEGHEISLTGRVNEISAGGCYVEMMSPLRLGTKVRLELTINSHTVHLEAVVRTSQPNFGMGLEFTHLVPVEAEKLQLIIGELSGSVPAQPYAAVDVPSAGVVEPVVSGGLENALARWFGLHDTLTRNEFIKLKQEAAHTTPELVAAFSTDGK